MADATASFKDVPELFEVGLHLTNADEKCLMSFRLTLERPWHRELKPLVRRAHSLPFRNNSPCIIASFRELGPPDLCHIVKSTGRNGQRDVTFTTFNMKSAY